MSRIALFLAEKSLFQSDCILSISSTPSEYIVRAIILISQDFYFSKNWEIDLHVSVNHY
jgi:hypothetical protein